MMRFLVVEKKLYLQNEWPITFCILAITSWPHEDIYSEANPQSNESCSMFWNILLADSLNESTFVRLLTPGPIKSSSLITWRKFKTPWPSSCQRILSKSKLSSGVNKTLKLSSHKSSIVPVLQTLAYAATSFRLTIVIV